MLHLAIVAVASEDVWTFTIEFDGLPLRLSEAHSFEIEDLDEFGTVDLGEYFEALGVDVPEWGFIQYNSGSGYLVCRGSRDMAELVETVLTSLSHHEKEIEYATAYLAILKPLNEKDRVSTVLKIGYRPSKLISSYIARIREVQAPLERDEFLSEIPPFPGDQDSTPRMTKEEIANRERTLTEMKGRLAELLRTSLADLETQLQILEKNEAEQGADDQLPARAESKAE